LIDPTGAEASVTTGVQRKIVAVPAFAVVVVLPGLLGITKVGLFNVTFWTLLKCIVFVDPLGRLGAAALFPFHTTLVPVRVLTLK